MNKKLKAWLDTLTEEQRTKALSGLGDLAAETEEDKLIAAARQAARLPEDPPAKSSDSVDTMRRAAGLE